MENLKNLEPMKILLIEDDPGDQKLVKTSLKNQKIANELLIVDNGENALDYLAQSKKGECPMPDLILLDLNMPGMGGKECLRRIKEDEELDTIPIVILTTSDAEQDILESYKLHASGYVKKPVTLQGFYQVMSELEDYWFVICRTIPRHQTLCTKN
ncbi:MAG: response regulator [Planctomycetes bacterium]|nr:response regulator [Planctomycetota bacterium]